MISISTALTILFIFLFIIGIGIHALVAHDLRDYKNMKKREDENAKVELRYSGGGILYHPPNWDKEKDGDSFNYDLRSWDGGKVWYATEIDKDCVDGLWGIKILGRANDLYPGLLEHLEGWNKLLEYVTKNGTIDAGDEGGIRALKEAGFTITTDSTKTK
jgi:hypothetical protein